MTIEATFSTQGVLTVDAFAAMLGTTPDALPAACAATLRAADLRHRVLRGDERQAQLARADAATAAADLARSGPHRAADWERGWSENLSEFERAGGATATLIPKYNRHSVLRLCGDYVQVAAPGFEYAVYTALRHALFQRWFAACDGVAEFGCGTGTSLLLLAERFPHLALLGCDWAAASQQILERLGAATNGRIAGRRFDMFRPDASLRLPPGTGVLTSAALEQLGADHGAFVDWLLAAAPAVCLHVEPLCELYDEDDPFDAVALRYHRRRNYLTGFLPRLWQLEHDGRIEILEQRRTGFGSFCHEGYSVVVWRPRAGGGARR